MRYDEPRMEIMRLENLDIVTLSNTGEEIPDDSGKFPV